MSPRLRSLQGAHARVYSNSRRHRGHCSIEFASERSDWISSQVRYVVLHTDPSSTYGDTTVLFIGWGPVEVFAVAQEVREVIEACIWRVEVPLLMQHQQVINCKIHI